MKRRTALIGTAVFAAGALAGAALEEVLYRRVLGRPDPEANEPIGSIVGDLTSVQTFDGTTIRCRCYGPVDSPVTIVFAHGALESHVVWHYQVRDLLADTGVRVVAYDARGHGSSGPARGPEGTTPFTEYALCRDMVAVVAQCTTGPVVLMGHSLGGMAILALWQHGEVVHIRDRVAGIVLVNSAYTADLRGWRGKGKRRERAVERVEDVLQRIPLPMRLVDRVRPGTNDLTLLIARLVYGKDPSPTHIAASVRMYQRTPSPTLTAFVDLSRFDAHTALPLVDVPALVVTGTRDVVTPMWLSQEIAARIPDAELVVFDDCGHTAPFERYEQLTAHARKFVERVS